MSKLLLLAAILMVGCTSTKEVVSVYKGATGPAGSNGNDGSPGKDGHSLVSIYQEATYCECGSSGGARLDVYMDVDDSLAVSEGDLYENSIIACNGHNGLNGLPGTDGEQGIPGEAGPSGQDGATGPMGLTGDTGAVGPQGAQGVAGPSGPVGATGLTGATGAAGTGATITVYPNSGACTSIAGSSYYVKSGDIYDNSTCSSSHKVAVLQGSGETFWVAAKMLATDGGSSSIRVINFN